MDRQSKDVIGSVHSVTQEAKEFENYATQSREEVEEMLLRSRESWEVLADEALHFPGRLNYALELLEKRITKLETQKEEAEATIKSLGKLHPVPGTDEFAECEHEGHVAQLLLAAAQATLQELQRARDSLPDVAVIMEGVAMVLKITLPHLAEGVHQTISVDAGSIRSLVVRIDGKLIAVCA